MLPTERHSCRSGRTAHGTAASYSAWHTHIACVGVVVLYPRGFWPSPACPRTYLLTSVIKAPSSSVVLHAFPGITGLSDSLPAPCDFSLPALYPRSVPDLAAGEGLSCSALLCPDVPPPASPERSSIRSGPGCCLLPSP